MRKIADESEVLFRLQPITARDDDGCRFEVHFAFFPMLLNDLHETIYVVRRIRDLCKNTVPAIFQAMLLHDPFADSRHLYRIVGRYDRRNDIPAERRANLQQELRIVPPEIGDVRDLEVCTIGGKAAAGCRRDARR